MYESDYSEMAYEAKYLGLMFWLLESFLWWEILKTVKGALSKVHLVA